MDTFKNILIGVGTVALVVFLILLILGIKIAGAVLFYALGFLLFLFVAGWIVYTIGKFKGRTDAKEQGAGSDKPKYT